MPDRPTNLGYLVALATGLVGGLLLGIPLVYNKNAVGMLIVAIGPVIALVFYRIWHRSTGTVEPTETKDDRLKLAGFAFVAAPVLAFLFALICIFAFEVAPPVDRAATVAQVTIIGFIAGSIVAFALAVSTGLK